MSNDGKLCQFFLWLLLQDYSWFKFLIDFKLWLLANLSEAFDCTDHKLLIIKLFWHEVSPSDLNLIHSYLTNRTQRIKINNSLSRWSIIEYGVPQGSVLDPLLFNIDLIDLFYECKDSNIANYVDDTTPYVCGENIWAVLSELQ